MAGLQDEPVWVQTLHALYEKGMQDDAFDKYGYTEWARQFAIADEINKRPVDVARALRSMERVNLINGVPSNNRKGYTLTEKGFGVAHSRSLRRHEQEIEDKRNQRQQELEDRRNKRQHDINRAIGFLTLGLVLIGYIQATTNALIGKDAPLREVNTVLVIGLLLVIVIWLLLRESGLFDGWEQ